MTATADLAREAADLARQHAACAQAQHQQNREAAVRAFRHGGTPAGPLSRGTLQREIFRMLDSHGHRKLESDQMKIFMQMQGFDGTDEEWSEEFQSMCEERGGSTSAKKCFDEEAFRALLDDRTEAGCHLSDSELQETYEALARKRLEEKRLKRLRDAREKRLQEERDRLLGEAIPHSDDEQALTSKADVALDSEEASDSESKESDNDSECVVDLTSNNGKHYRVEVWKRRMLHNKMAAPAKPGHTQAISPYLREWLEKKQMKSRKEPVITELPAARASERSRSRSRSRPRSHSPTPSL
mmetsp:Transcript_47192/g.82134  ORF Transcript_47192/g.82134 Transcript_47192/m.82134 type:complete len:299 (+) Transcript_47192:86-982(+)